MIVAGLTGSIAMGKSTVAGMFADLGCPVFDADAAVRDYYETDGVTAVERLFPGVENEGKIDRQRLAARVLDDQGAMRRLEALVHPAVAERRQRFLDRARSAGQKLVFLDVPLLFETRAENAVDLVVVVSAGEASQRARALARPGMTPEKFDALLARQLPDPEKRRRADFVIDTEQSLNDTRQQVVAVMRDILSRRGKENTNA